MDMRGLWPGPPWQQVMDAGQLYLLVAAVVRGTNYLIAPPLPPEANPLKWFDPDGLPDVWGWMFVLFGLLGLAGEWWYRRGTSTRRWMLSWLAFVWLMAGYLMVGILTLIGVFLRSPIYGFAVPADLIVVAVACAVCAQRRNQVIPRDY